jgi:hypothetical protein
LGATLLPRSITSAVDYAKFRPHNATNPVNIIQYRETKNVDKNLLVNFSIPSNLLLPALKEFPSTYNKTLGNGINSYEKDRENFLADRTKWPGAKK